MIMTQQKPLPKTANLLACKQWWKVCFLYGDQEKYYRQIYGRAATQRLTNCANECNKSKDFSDTFRIKEKSPINIHDDPFLFGINEKCSDESGVDVKNVNET
jgi:hypothetical protein